jgi:protein dithiol:quinone oxidoreductase
MNLKTIVLKHAAAFIASASFGAVLLALILQHGFNMQPCAWCTVQRLVYLAIGAIALVAMLTKGLLTTRILMSLITLLGLCGVVAALYQHFVASSSASCKLSFADKLMINSGLDGGIPWLFQATALCQDANIPLVGVPFAIWSLALFAIITVVALISANQPKPLTFASLSRRL